MTYRMMPRPASLDEALEVVQRLQEHLFRASDGDQDNSDTDTTDGVSSSAPLGKTSPDTVRLIRFPHGGAVVDRARGAQFTGGDFVTSDPDEILPVVFDGRTWREIGRRQDSVFVPAKKYGARPNTGADMTTAIQRAFDNCPIGATLVFDPGTYIVSSDLTLSREINVWAYGAIFNGGTSVFTVALLTIGDTTGVVGTQSQRMFIGGLTVTRTATVDVIGTLLHTGIRVYNVVGAQLDLLTAENFQIGFHFYANILGCYTNTLENYFVQHCQYGIVIETAATGFVNENTFIAGRHLVGGWSAAVREANFEQVRILFPVGAASIPNNNRFYGCDFEGSSLRKLRCEGTLNRFDHCRWEQPKAAGFEITIGEATRASTVYVGNAITHGNALDVIAENLLTRVEFLNTTGALSNLLLISHTRTYWWGGTAAAPTMSLGNSINNTHLALDIISTGTGARRMGIRAGGSGLAGTPLGTIDWYDTSSVFHNALALDNTNFPTNRPLRVERGMIFNFGQSNNDFQLRGQTLLNLLYGDASANALGIGHAAPLRLLDILDSASPQLRLTHTAGTRFTDLHAHDDATYGGLALLPATNASSLKIVTLFGTTEGTGWTFLDDIGGGSGLWLRTTQAKDVNFNIGSAQTYNFKTGFGTIFALQGPAGVTGVANFKVPTGYSIDDMTTNTVLQALQLERTTSGVAGAGIGVRVNWLLENDAGSIVAASEWDVVFDSAAAGARDSSGRFKFVDAGTLKEIMRIAGALPGVRIENAVGGAPAALLDVRGDAIFNEDGASVNSRWEGDTDPNLLFISGVSDRIGIGVDPSSKLHVVIATASPDAVLDCLRIERQVSGGSATAGIGVEQRWVIENGGGSAVTAGNWRGIMDVVTAGAEDTSFRFEARDAGATKEIVRIDGAVPGVLIHNGATASPLERLEVDANIRALSLRLDGDTGSGVAATLTIPNVVAAVSGVTPATLATTGGGPTGAMQSHWLKIYDGTTVRYIPVWT